MRQTEWISLTMKKSVSSMPNFSFGRWSWRSLKCLYTVCNAAHHRYIVCTAPGLLYVDSNTPWLFWAALYRHPRADGHISMILHLNRLSNCCRWTPEIEGLHSSQRKSSEAASHQQIPQPYFIDYLVSHHQQTERVENFGVTQVVLHLSHIVI